MLVAESSAAFRYWECGFFRSRFRQFMVSDVGSGVSGLTGMIWEVRGFITIT